MARYAIVDAAGIVVNVIDWDGNCAWNPPEGCRAILDVDHMAEPAGTHDGTAFIARAEGAPNPGARSRTKARPAKISRSAK